MMRLSMLDDGLIDFMRELDFMPLSAPGRKAFPPINIHSGEDEVVVMAEVPGIDAEKISVTASGNSLTIAGSIEGNEPPGTVWHRRERKGGAFERILRLPFPAGSDDIEASLSRGVLVLKVKRPANLRPTRIEIKSA